MIQKACKFDRIQPVSCHSSALRRPQIFLERLGAGRYFYLFNKIPGQVWHFKNVNFPIQLTRMMLRCKSSVSFADRRLAIELLHAQGLVIVFTRNETD